VSSRRRRSYRPSSRRCRSDTEIERTAWVSVHSTHSTSIAPLTLGCVARGTGVVSSPSRHHRMRARDRQPPGRWGWAEVADRAKARDLRVMAAAVRGEDPLDLKSVVVPAQRAHATPDGDEAKRDQCFVFADGGVGRAGAGGDDRPLPRLWRECERNDLRQPPRRGSGGRSCPTSASPGTRGSLPPDRTAFASVQPGQTGLPRAPIKATARSRLSWS
jgi:hypothetical protein